MIKLRNLCNELGIPLADLREMAKELGVPDPWARERLGDDGYAYMTEQDASRVVSEMLARELEPWLIQPADTTTEPW